MGCGSSSEATKQTNQGGKAGGKGGKNFEKQESRFSAISDKYESVEQVQQALRQGGLESCQLIVAVDFTKSNEWQGTKTFGARCLHTIGNEPNQYEVAISAIARTLSPFDDDKLIPVLGFGDATTGDRDCFSFFANNRSARGLDEVLFRYREMAPGINLSGPTSFEAVVKQATSIVNESGGKYHILLILADGQVSDGTPEMRTIQAIAEASKFPLSIVCVGVGDGPWDDLEMFDDKITNRNFDNFQFVPLTRLLQLTNGQMGPRFEAGFALRALMEIPEQYKYIKKLNLLSNPVNMGRPLAPKPLAPPVPERGGVPGPAAMGMGGMPPAAVPPPPAAVPPPPAGYPSVGGPPQAQSAYPAVGGGL